MEDKFLIADGEKYALIALPRLPLDGNNVPLSMELAPGLLSTRRLPFDLEPHWREWIGTVRADQITTASLILVAKGHSNTPDVFDEENQRLIALVGRFYQGLQMAVPIWADGDVMRLTGANRGGHVDVRQIASIDSPSLTHYGKAELIGPDALRVAAELVPTLSGFPKGKYLRLCRILNAFFSGIAANDLRERLHQFCRCIEGLLLADPGHTTKQFKSRTELFVGSRLHEFMGNLYKNRSAVEHMNDPVLAATTENERWESFMEMTHASENIARYCLLNILLKSDLLKRYQDETSLAAFWNLDPSERSKIWGAPLNAVVQLSAP